MPVEDLQLKKRQYYRGVEEEKIVPLDGIQESTDRRARRKSRKSMTGGGEGLLRGGGS